VARSPKTRIPHRGTRGQPEASRHAILQAALSEFAREGLAGARMDAIAEAAGVNKALLYYYFHDKETLYGEILDRFFQKLAERIMAVCQPPGSAGLRFLSYARTHFDSVAESPYYAHIFMSELMSAGRGGSTHLDRIFARYMKPIGGCVLGLMQEGISSGEFRAVDPNQFLPSTIGSIVHYFLTAPLRQKFMPELYAAPRQQLIQERRAAVLDFIAAALFTNRESGIALAAMVAAQPASNFRGGLIAPEKKGGRRRASAPPATPAPEAAANSAPESESAPPPMDSQPPVQNPDPAAAPPPSPVGYRWMDRWFPDMETARRIMREEKRLGITDKRKLPTNLDEEWPE
jgi:TetR/AcrR family transcriptional regulator